MPKNKERSEEELEQERHAAEFEAKYGKAYDPTASEEAGIEPSVLPFDDKESAAIADVASMAAGGAGALTKGGIKSLVMQAAKQEGKRELTAPMKKAIEKKMMDKKMESLKSAPDSPFREGAGPEKVLTSADLTREAQGQLNTQLAKKAPTADTISYGRDPITGQQDYLANPAIKTRLTGDSVAALPSIPPAPIPAAEPAAPRGTIRKRRAEGMDEEEALPPAEVSGVY